MPYFRSIRSRRQRKTINASFDLQLTSMLDILVIILVFLLKSYAASTTRFTALPGLEMPVSKSEDSPPDSLHLVITPEAMTFENERILEFVQTAESIGNVTQANYKFKPSDLDEGGRRILPLYDALVKARDQSELLRAKSKARTADGQPLPFEGILAIQADRRINYDILRRVMYTAATVDFDTFRFLARKEIQ